MTTKEIISNVLQGKVVATKVGLNFIEDISVEQWQRLGEELGIISESLGLMIGDWMNYKIGNQEFVLEDRFADAMRMTGYKRATLAEFCLVSRSIPMAIRDERLSFAHYRLIAHVPEPMREYWIDAAIEWRMTTRQLGQSIKAGRPLDIDEIKIFSTSRMLSVHPFVNRTLSFFKGMKQSGWFEKSNVDQIRNLQSDLRPVVDVYNELEEIISRKESI